jgi:hypothetical protein
MPRFLVEDWKDTDLLRIIDTESAIPSHVVGYVEPALKAKNDQGNPWCAWFKSSTDIKPFPMTDDHPDGTYAEFASKEQAIAAVEALNIC